MKLVCHYTSHSWDFGFGVQFPARGGYVGQEPNTGWPVRVTTIRPWALILYLGPLTLELEGSGRADVYDAGFPAA